MSRLDVAFVIVGAVVVTPICYVVTVILLSL
jgi:hypothetical protein